MVTRLEDEGEKVLVAAIYDETGEFIGGHALPVYINVKPR